MGRPRQKNNSFKYTPDGGVVRCYRKRSLSILAPIAGAAIGGGLPIGSALGAALGSGVAKKVQGGSLLDSIKSGGLSYVGSKVGANLLGDKLGTVGQAFGSTADNAVAPEFFDVGLGDFIGDSASNSIGATIASTNLGGVAGSYAANSLVDLPQQEEASKADVTPFSPSRAAEEELPTGLRGFGGLTDNQISSNIATQGVYGYGNGPQEQSYFNNLINRRLVDDSGNVGDLSNLSPIENSYLQKLGLGGYSNSRDLLEAMSKWRAA